LVLAFPPIDLWFLAWFGLVPFFVSIYNRTGWQVFVFGLFWGIAFFFGTVYWTAHSMTVYGGIPLLIGILVLLLLVLYLSLFPAIFAQGVSYLQGGILIVPALWTTLEYIRSFLFTGFPWVSLGYSQFPLLPLIQLSDITGVYGLSFLIVAVNLLLFKLFLWFREGDGLPIKEAIGVFLVMLAVLVYGFFRIDEIDKAFNNGTPLKIGIVQGNIDQNIKWNPTYQEETVRIYTGLSREVARSGVRLIVWPETATPFYLQSDERFKPLVHKVSLETSTYLLTGSPAYEYKASGIAYYNSAFLIGPTGETLGRYDKIHLVPFGEYVPLKRLLPFIHKLVEGIGNFTPGDGPDLLSMDKERFGVLICFEAIFPEISRAFVKEGADFLINITNDAWFGRTSASYQHIAQAAFRAVENRRFLVRAANTGISGVVDPVGRIKVKSEIFKRETLVDTIRLVERGSGLTFYTRYGNVFAVGCGVVVVLVTLSKTMSNSKSKRQNSKVQVKG
ncbi:MAG: apolipoprotein N-acyltransferase, partial [Deltaproteobacteria bacterium]|nr:apolipoprotein N-acyltransferase [Deltaproteobacteria bacterium]